jgi:multiple sugar transport system permease protein
MEKARPSMKTISGRNGVTGLRSRKKNSFIKSFFLKFVPLAAIITFILFPFYWTVITAFKNEGDIVKRPIKYFPDPATFDNFITAWKKIGFSVYFRNSVIVALLACILIMVLSFLVGYALSRYKFRGKNAFILVLLCTQFIPGAMLIIPLFIIFRNMGLINNFLSLILVYSTFEVPYNSVVMRSFISNVPMALEEAAYIDGCGTIRAIVLVVLPVMLPGMVAVAAFAFIGCWNEFLYALMFFTKNKLFTIPVGLSFMQGQYDVNYGTIAAGSVIALIPAILLFAYVQKYLISGLTAGSLKG